MVLFLVNFKVEVKGDSKLEKLIISGNETNTVEEIKQYASLKIFREFTHLGIRDYNDFIITSVEVIWFQKT